MSTPVVGVANALRIVSEQLVPTTAVFELHRSGVIVATSGLFITKDNDGKKISMNAQDGWVAPNAAKLLDAVQNANFVRFMSVPQRDNQGSYNPNFFDFGLMVSPKNPEDFGIDGSFVTIQNRAGAAGTEIGKEYGVFCLTAQAYMALQAGQGLLPLDIAHETAPFGARDLDDALAYCRENGPYSENKPRRRGGYRITSTFPPAADRPQQVSQSNDDDLAELNIGVNVAPTVTQPARGRYVGGQQWGN